MTENFSLEVVTHSALLNSQRRKFSELLFCLCLRGNSKCHQSLTFGLIGKSDIPPFLPPSKYSLFLPLFDGEHNLHEGKKKVKLLGANVMP